MQQEDMQESVLVQSSEIKYASQDAARSSSWQSIMLKIRHGKAPSIKNTAHNSFSQNQRVFRFCLIRISSHLFYGTADSLCLLPCFNCRSLCITEGMHRLCHQRQAPDPIHAAESAHVPVPFVAFRCVAFIRVHRPGHDCAQHYRADDEGEEKEETTGKKSENLLNFAFFNESRALDQ